jgi:hypothetical protein
MEQKEEKEFKNEMDRIMEFFEKKRKEHEIQKELEMRNLQNIKKTKILTKQEKNKRLEEKIKGLNMQDINLTEGNKKGIKENSLFSYSKLNNDLNINLHKCLMFCLLDLYLNPDMGAEPEPMYILFSGMIKELSESNPNTIMKNFYDEIYQFLGNKIKKEDPFFDTKSGFNYNELKKKRFNILDLGIESHSFKLVVDNEKDECSIINSGLGMQENIIYNRIITDEKRKNSEIEINVTKSLNIFDSIKKKNKIKECYDKLEELSLSGSKNIKLNNFSEKHCKPQLSGSCTFFSILYLVYYKIFKMNENERISDEEKEEKNEYMIYKFREDLKKFSIEKIKDFIFEFLKHDKYELFYNIKQKKFIFEFLKGIELLILTHREYLNFDDETILNIRNKINNNIYTEINSIKKESLFKINKITIKNNKLSKKIFYDLIKYMDLYNFDTVDFRNNCLIITNTKNIDVCTFLLYCIISIENDFLYSEFLAKMDCLYLSDEMYNDFEILIHLSTFFLWKCATNKKFYFFGLIFILIFRIIEEKNNFFKIQSELSSDFILNPTYVKQQTESKELRDQKLNPKIEFNMKNFYFPNVDMYIEVSEYMKKYERFITIDIGEYLTCKDKKIVNYYYFLCALFSKDNLPYNIKFWLKPYTEFKNSREIYIRKKSKYDGEIYCSQKSFYSKKHNFPYIKDCIYLLQEKDLQDLEEEKSYFLELNEVKFIFVIVLENFKKNGKEYEKYEILYIPETNFDKSIDNKMHIISENTIYIINTFELDGQKFDASNIYDINNINIADGSIIQNERDYYIINKKILKVKENTNYQGLDLKKNKLYFIPKQWVGEIRGRGRKSETLAYDVELAEYIVPNLNESKIPNIEINFHNLFDFVNVHDNLYVNPFDFIISEKNLEKILSFNNRLLISKEISAFDETSKFFSSYVSKENNFYINSKKIFLKSMESINEKDFKLMYSNIYTLLVIYIYSLFYNITEGSGYYNKNMNYVKENLKISNIDIYNLLESEEINENLLLSIVNPKNGEYSFSDLIFFDKNLKKKIFLNKINSTNNIFIKLPGNIYFNETNDIEYVFNNIKYITNELIDNKEERIENYTKFKNKQNDKYIYFSYVFPPLEKNNDEIKLYNANFVLENDNYKKNSIIQNINIVFNESNNVIFKNNNNYLIYTNYISYNTNNILYFSVKNNSPEYSQQEIFIFDFDIEKNRITKHNIFERNDIYNIITTSEKLYICLNDTRKFKNLKNMDNLWGSKSSSFEETYLNEIEFVSNKKKTKSLYFEYIIKRDIKNEIIDVIFENTENYIFDNIITYVLLQVLAKSYQYNLLENLLNKFLSYLRVDVVYSLLNHPYSYIFHKYILDQYKLKSDFFEIKYNEIKYSPVYDDIINYYKISDLLTTSSKNILLEDIVKKTLSTPKEQFSYRELTDDYTQRECIHNIIYNLIQNINQKDINNYLYEILMGSGKSKVIIPFISYYAIFNIPNERQIFIVLPEHLVNDMYNKILAFANNMPLCMVKKIGSIENGENCENIDYIKNLKKGIIIINDKLMKKLLVSENFGYNKVLNNHHENRIMIVDEVDDCVNPLKSNFNLRKNEITLDSIHDELFDFIIDYADNINEFDKKKGNLDINFINIMKKLNLNDKLTCILDDLDKCSDFPISDKNASVTYILKKIYDSSNLIISKKYIYNKDYGLNDNINKKSFFYAIPYLGINIPSPSSEFNDIYTTLMLTSYIYLNDDFILNKDKKTKLRDEDLLEFVNNIKINYGIDSNDKSSELESIINDNHDLFFKINPQDETLKKIKKIFEDNGSSKIMIKYYLKNSVFKKMKYIESYINTSFLELLHPKAICHSYIGFTGTTDYIIKLNINGKNEYPKIGGKETFKLIDSFSKLNEEKKSAIESFNNINFIDFSVATNIYNFIRDSLRRPDKNKHIKCLIDTAAIFREKSNKEYAIDMIKKENLDLDFVLYFEDDTLVKIDKDSNISVYGETEQKDETLQKDFLDKKTLIFFDNIHTRGTDIVLPSIHGLITISHINDTVNVLQGIYRLRKFGQENGQTCEFLINSELENKINNETKTESGESKLLNYLENNKNIYIESQIPDLLIQTIYSNTKWKLIDHPKNEGIKIWNYDTKTINIPLVPIPKFNPLRNIKNIISNNYVIDNKVKKHCNNDNMQNIDVFSYCRLLKEKYIDTNHHYTDKSTSTSVSTTISISISISQSISNITHTKDLYRSKNPLKTNISEFEIYSLNSKKHNYLSYYSYLNIPPKRNFDELWINFWDGNINKPKNLSLESKKSKIFDDFDRNNIFEIIRKILETKPDGIYTNEVNEYIELLRKDTNTDTDTNSSSDTDKKINITNIIRNIDSKKLKISEISDYLINFDRLNFISYLFSLKNSAKDINFTDEINSYITDLIDAIFKILPISLEDIFNKYYRPNENKFDVLINLFSLTNEIIENINIIADFLLADEVDEADIDSENLINLQNQKLKDFFLKYKHSLEERKTRKETERIEREEAKEKMRKAKEKRRKELLEQNKIIEAKIKKIEEQLAFINTNIEQISKTIILIESQILQK